MFFNCIFLCFLLLFYCSNLLFTIAKMWSKKRSLKLNFADGWRLLLVWLPLTSLFLFVRMKRTENSHLSFSTMMSKVWLIEVNTKRLHYATKKYFVNDYFFFKQKLIWVDIQFFLDC